MLEIVSIVQLIKYAVNAALGISGTGPIALKEQVYYVKMELKVIFQMNAIIIVQIIHIQKVSVEMLFNAFLILMSMLEMLHINNFITMLIITKHH